MPLTSITSSNLAAGILGALHRVVLLCPGFHDEVAEALTETWPRLGAENVTVIVDTNPEVMRLGYGTIEAVGKVKACADQMGAVLCSEPDIRICVAIIDDAISIFAPKPYLIATESLGETSGITIQLSDTTESIAAQLGAGPLGQMSRKIGMDGVSEAKMQAIKKDLDANPPQKFDLARKVTVFNARIEFVELEVKGCKVTRKEVSLPQGLIGVQSADVERRLRSAYRLIEPTEEITKAQLEVETHRKEIEKEFLRVIPGFGMGILKKDRKEFDQAIEELDKTVGNFSGFIEHTKEVAITASINEIVTALAPALKANPTAEYDQWGSRRRSPDPEEFLFQKLDKCFRKAEKALDQMRVTVVIKGVTYELLQQIGFVDAARSAFPELAELFREFDAASAV
jgi:hypothetical protein